ncbi:beta-lactamase-like protein [Endogone sp. FLAS-F59071]|nr:beta-lactamase-like protein [Endogone sp. FLAS-F59071]|eukprot:RUS21503.1 beta-lactamase-like protein [Endogone sp. FLAS-F59071]
MKLQSLGYAFHSKNCFLLKLRQMSILFNCPLELNTFSATNTTPAAFTEDDDLSIAPEDIYSFILSESLDGSSKAKSNPNIEAGQGLPTFIFRSPDFSLIDISTIDFVLITNHNHMLGLPFLTEYLGFKGKIFATEPVVEFGRQLMEELVHYFGSLPSGKGRTYQDKIFSPITHTSRELSSERWRPIYNLKDVKLCIDKIQQVRYREQMVIYDTLKVAAYSAGYSLGSSNWQIEAGYEKIAFLSTSSKYESLHPSSFDDGVLKDADVVVVSDLRKSGEREGAANDGMVEKMLNKVCGNVARTLQRSGNVLFPVSTTGIVFDLIGSLREHLASMGIEIGTQTSRSVPFYMISPVANKSLQYSNICGEWMQSTHQDLIYVPEAPLPHGELMASQNMRPFPSVDAAILGSDFREPCVVFTGDWRGLRQGPVDWFWKMWGDKKTNTCVLIDYHTLLTTLPHALRMNIVHSPIDIRLSFADVREKITQLDRPPQFVLVPREQDEDSVMLDETETKEIVRKEWIEDRTGTTWKLYDDGEVVEIDVNRGWERVVISEKLAESIRSSLVTSNFDILNASMIAPVAGVLSIHNNRYELHPVTTPQYLQALELNKQRSLWGNNIKVERVLQELGKRGVQLSSVQVNCNSATQAVTLVLPVDMHAQIEFQPREHTTVVKARDEDRFDLALGRVSVCSMLIDGLRVIDVNARKVEDALNKPKRLMGFDEMT